MAKYAFGFKRSHRRSRNLNWTPGRQKFVGELPLSWPGLMHCSREASSGSFRMTGQDWGQVSYLLHLPYDPLRLCILSQDTRDDGLLFLRTTRVVTLLSYQPRPYPTSASACCSSIPLFPLERQLIKAGMELGVRYMLIELRLFTLGTWS